jgi:hypothetical protein
MTGKCALCKNVKSKFNQITRNPHTKVSIEQWKKEGKVSKVVTESKSVRNIVNEFSKKVEDYKTHFFLSKLQSRKKTEDLKNLPRGSAIVMVDFSENETVVPQDEAQSAYYSRLGLSVFTVQLYVTPDDPQGGEILSRSICIASDNLEHTSSTTDMYMREVFNYISREFNHISNVIVWSDGAPSHFKNKFTIANLLNLERDYKIKIQWNFFATSHGKSPCDGIGGNIKRMVNDRTRTQNLMIQCASQFVEEANKIGSKIEVWELAVSKIESSKAAFELWKDKVASITGIRSQHKFETSGLDSIKSYETSYGHAEKIHKVLDVER